ncbi:MAG: hypothetical protein ABL925_08900 [Methylococcales bacterium]
MKIFYQAFRHLFFTRKADAKPSRQQHMIKLIKPYTTLTSLLIMHSALAFESDNAALSNTVGATDLYQITCPANTDHVGFRIKDISALVQPAPQLFNIHINKANATPVDATGVKAAEQSALALQGGAGKYLISIDTIGTNLELTKAQSYRYQYQCLYTDQSLSPAKLSGKKTIKNGATAKFAIICTDKKQTRTKPALVVDQLNLTVSNNSLPTTITSSSQILNAQLTKRDRYDSANIKIYAANATDSNGDDVPSEFIKVDAKQSEVINDSKEEEFFLTVDNTGTKPDVDNSKLYSFSLNCLNSSNTDAGEATVSILQDQ